MPQIVLRAGDPAYVRRHKNSKAGSPENRHKGKEVGVNYSMIVIHALSKKFSEYQVLDK